MDVRGVNGFVSSPTGSENILAGTKIKLQSLSPADVFMIQGVYSRNAIRYSGIPDQMWGENGQVNRNGLQQFIGDAYFNGLTWGAPSAWSLEAVFFQHFFTPEICVYPEASVAGLSWSNTAGLTDLTAHDALDSRRGHRRDAGQEPELRSSPQLPDDQPGAADPPMSASIWVSNSSGLVGRLRITRNF